MLDGEKLEEAHARYVALKHRIERGGSGKVYRRCLKSMSTIPKYVREFKPTHNLPIISGAAVVRELSFDELYTKYHEHHRLIVFAQKGLKCAWPGCSRVGERLIITMDIAGGAHVDVYTQDLHMMTVDHINPKSNGGGEELENKQPMCFKHNFAKGSKPMPQ